MEKNNGNQSLIRGLRLIEILSQFPNGCSLLQLSNIAELNKSTVHRLLQGLQQEGFVQPATQTGSYRLTSKCLSIGQKVLSSVNIINLVSPYLEALNLELGETINFSMRENNHAIMIYKLEPTMGIMRTRAYIGQHLRLYCSAMGKLYLAYDQPACLDRYWQENETKIERLTCNTITELPLMKKELEEVKKQGFAVDKEENEIGISCLACPIFDSQNHVKYALSVSISTAKLQQLGIEFLLNKIKPTAQLISQELGWTP
ncbi:IclR family transcriptional regulator [Bisgaard Taxon 10/6]|uniref:IclR family transcriptional regulator n=1 Tax=Exercitatus varius TaxID=67857 RepID=A0AAW6QBY7_9PAST|nr:IclR family transcriptional regulator [Exercitatus varius]MDG2940489.1 IclR family transcriptional regulator [Exercitatus varius]MDG2940745.1 IclR family transcriptional regulator [Exercitatus varius]MDG2946747.1 IclR family transcriptional regulator [Exercitatus varius]MDG2950823.1 IclR family transcriptional regulator [Exercitatus varius]MDG2963377.1 IclR family transcriptional regulator [Exercitatus varius]